MGDGRACVRFVAYHEAHQVHAGLVVTVVVCRCLVVQHQGAAEHEALLRHGDASQGLHLARRHKGREGGETWAAQQSVYWLCVRLARHSQEPHTI